MSGLNPCSAAGLEEFCQALVFEASNHSLIVPCNVSGVKAHNALALRRAGAAAQVRPTTAICYMLSS